MNLIKFDYNKIRLFNDDLKSLSNENIKLGTMIFIEKKSRESVLEHDDEKDKEEEDPTKLREIPMLSPSYQRSKLCVLFEEQRLKISVTYNDPLPSKSTHDRIEELLMSPSMLKYKRQTVEYVFEKKKKLEFNHALRISKECTLAHLKSKIASELQLDMNTFRLRKSSNQPELRDMKQTLNSAGIHDGGLVYVEYGVPTGPKQTCVTFSLYDPNKLLTDPHKKKKTLAQKLFEYPFKKDIKVSVMKKEIVKIINTLFPLYRDKYTFPEAVKLLKKEEKQRNEQEIENLKKATAASKKETETPTETETETKPSTEATVEATATATATAEAPSADTVSTKNKDDIDPPESKTEMQSMSEVAAKIQPLRNREK